MCALILPYSLDATESMVYYHILPTDMLECRVSPLEAFLSQFCRHGFRGDYLVPSLYEFMLDNHASTNGNSFFVFGYSFVAVPDRHPPLRDPCVCICTPDCICTALFSFCCHLKKHTLTTLILKWGGNFTKIFD